MSKATWTEVYKSGPWRVLHWSTENQGFGPEEEYHVKHERGAVTLQVDGRTLAIRLADSLAFCRARPS